MIPPPAVPGDRAPRRHPWAPWCHPRGPRRHPWSSGSSAASSKQSNELAVKGRGEKMDKSSSEQDIMSVFGEMRNV